MALWNIFKKNKKEEHKTEIVEFDKKEEKLKKKSKKKDVKLKKEICQHCFKSHGLDWTDKDEGDWNNKRKVRCPRHPEEKAVDVTYQQPKWCRFKHQSDMK